MAKFNNVKINNDYVIASRMEEVKTAAKVIKAMDAAAAYEVIRMWAWDFKGLELPHVDDGTEILKARAEVYAPQHYSPVYVGAWFYIHSEGYPETFYIVGADINGEFEEEGDGVTVPAWDGIRNAYISKFTETK